MTFLTDLKLKTFPILFNNALYRYKNNNIARIFLRLLNSALAQNAIKTMYPNI